MLAKSKRSALVLSAITVLVFGLVSALVNILIPYLMNGDLPKAEEPAALPEGPRILPRISYFCPYLFRSVATASFSSACRSRSVRSACHCSREYPSEKKNLALNLPTGWLWESR